MTDDLVKRLRDYTCDCFSGNSKHMTWQAADRIEALEAKNRLLEQSQAAHALAGLGVDVVAAYNSGLAALKAGCKEERLRAEKAETRIETLETALREAYKDCLNAVEKVKSDPFTELGVHHKGKWGDTTARDWMVAFAEDVEREIKARAALGEKKDG